ncbi:T9SS type A sorting domain-containing protein [uncultured Tenacibaculum sp.]|uniref:T9SS type A sorting domain-containing protein n=1 Tax=uncultured Tenacibaculum sp. TaxID=174713 RepID=UPI00261DFC40|nr:T9SS type A sorting domain-containing protein [uncultured Tenacibaculum sp.]
MKLKFLVILFLLLSNLLFAQETNIPDDNFENYLETHNANGGVVSVGDTTSMGNGIANDNKVYTSNISAVTSLDISRLTIANAAGIEDFTALQNFNCFENSLSSIDFSQNLALHTINIGKNNLTSLNLSGNPLLTSLSCSQNQIVSINISQNILLETLGCSNNQLSSLDISNNVALKNLYCYTNPLGSLDVTQNLLLEDLDCVDTQLTVLDVSKNLELMELQVYENNLTNLDVSNNLKLVELYAESNNITSLDVSRNINLVDLSIAYNQLTYLNIKNGNNSSLDPRDFDIRNNPDLTCVTVDNVTYAETQFTRKDNQTEYKLFCTETNVPDNNFEAYLETHNATGGVVSVGDPTSMGNGIANDNKVATERIQNITYLNISNQGITDLAGLEDFTSLEELRAFDNTITSGNLDLTTNTNLIEIVCSDMGLNTIDISGLSVLERVELRNNNLSNIDISSNSNLNYFNVDGNNFTTINISGNILLSDLRIRDNAVLNSIDISNNSNLKRLYVGGNSLSILDVSNNTLLETISAGKNQLGTINVNGLNNLTDLFLEDMPSLTSLDVSSNINLEDIGVNGTGLSALDLSSLTKLIEVYANNTVITELDFSASPDLEYVECKNSQLTSLNIKNDNNSSSIELYATGNPNLFCIQVDDPTDSYLSRWEKDATVSFSDDCNWTYIPDDNFEVYLETHDANGGFVSVGDPTSMGNGIANDDYVKTTNIENVINLFLNFQGITDFTGIEAFASLEFVVCFGNVINTSLDFTSNTNLKRIDASDMGLTSIDITGLTALERMDISRNSLTSVDLSTNTSLKEFMISSNNLTKLDVSNNLLLEDLQIHETTLSNIDLSKNVNLTRIVASLNQFTSLNTQNNTLLETLNLLGNPLISYDVSHLTNLKELNLDETNITSIDISKNINLVKFNARNINELEGVNVRNGNNSSFTEFRVYGCPNLTCIEVDDPTADYLSQSHWVKDGTANYSKYCRLTYIPDANFENYLETHKENTGGTTLGNDNSLGNGVLDNYVPTEKIENLQILFIDNENISDFTGLQEFKGLERFRAYGNSVNGDLDLTANVNLTQVYCANMGLTSINVSGLTNLFQLDINDNDINNIDISTNSIVEYVDLDNNNISTLDITNNTEIRTLLINNNNISTLALSQNLKLVTLSCSGNSISTINIQNNALIETVEIFDNPLNSIDVSNQPALLNLLINNTNVSELNLSNNTNISNLVCNDTAITELDLSNNANMFTLKVHNNAITELNLANLTRLDSFNASNNQLTLLNLRNGNNTSIASVDITGNASLTCVEVDDSTASELVSWFKDNTTNYAEYCRMTYVPDDAFETFLENNGYGNGVIDDYVYTALVEISEGFNLHNGLVEDMTGIEDFKNMWFLGCRNNANLTSIDLSKNTKLTNVTLANNNLASLDLNNNLILEKIYLDGNFNLGNVDISMLSNLNTLSVSDTGINSIDISNNPLMRILNLNDNNFTELDISMYPSIVQLRIANNQLTSLNVANGNNDNFTWFDGQGNSGLTCIKADKVVQLFPDIWVKDATARFALYCDVTYIADTNFENYLETHDADGNVVALGDATSLGNGITNDNAVYTEKIKTVINLDLNRLDITNLTGIEAFAALEILNLEYNDLTTLDLSSNSNLRILDVAENDLTEIDLSVIPSLEEVELRSNKINSLILDNPKLKILRASKNQYTTLDVTNCPELEELSLTQTLLVSLDVRNGNNNLITNFNAKFNDYLTCIEVDYASASYLSTWEKDVTANFTEDCNNSIWTGINGTDWTDNGNWILNAVALTTQNVIIPVLVTSPIIESGVTAEINDLEIQELSSFTIENNGITIINGNLNNTGTISIGSSANTSGTLIVRGTANGNVTYERSGLLANKWSIITAPVSGQSIKDFIESSENDIRVNTTVTPNRYAVAYYDDTKTDGNKWTYYTADDIQTNTLTFEKGKGYIVSRATNGSVKFTGTLTTTDVSISVNEDKWNAIGNPYTAFLPINNNSNENFIQENISKFHPENIGVYVWDNSQNKYVAKSLVSSSTSLTLGQGFFVKTGNGINTINFKENQRQHEGTDVDIFSRSKSSVPSIQIFAESKGITVNTHIKYYQTATKGLDPGYDIGNFGSSSFDVFTHLLEESKGNDFTIQSLPNSGYENMVIPLGIKSKADEEVSITLKYNNLPKGIEVYIEDKKLNKYTKIEDTQTKYKVVFEENVNGVGRFFIHTKEALLSVTEIEKNDVYIYTIPNKLIIKGIQKQFTVTLFNALGVSVLKNEYKGLGKNEIDLTNLSKGVYIVKVVSETKITTKKIIIID